MFTPEQQRFIKTFATEINNGYAAIFAGAGLSVPAGFVNWKALLKDLAEEINLDINRESDLTMVAQYYCNSFNRSRINDKIVNAFTTLKSGSDNHQILARLDIDTYWTTNYDQLIEKSLEQHGKTVDVKIVKEHFARYIKKKNAIVYKMHGDKDSPHDAVLTKDDYDYYQTKRELFSTALRGDLLSKKFLFIGFSFEDPNLDFVLSRIKILLETHTPEHYCFFKNVSIDDYNDENKTEEQNKLDFLYAEIKQSLKISDLKRYGINPVMLDSYSEITNILAEIEVRTKRKNIFISGAAIDYTPFSEEQAYDFIHRLSYKLAEKEYKIVSGYGLGIGSMVINGALDFKIKSNFKSLDDLLVLRPFPQKKSSDVDFDKQRDEYRKDMISSAGIAIFIFGNKQKDDVPIYSDGMRREFDICYENKVVPIPIACTGFVAKELWDEVTLNIDKYLPDDNELRKTFMSLGEEQVNNDNLINSIIKIIGILQHK